MLADVLISNDFMCFYVMLLRRNERSID